MTQFVHMKIAIVLPSSRPKERGDFVEPDGNHATDEEWSLEIKLGERASGRPQSIKWLNLIDSERAEETEKRKKRERTFAFLLRLLLHRERRAPQCTEKQFRLPQFRQNESAPSLSLPSSTLYCSRQDWMEVVMAWLRGKNGEWMMVVHCAPWAREGSCMCVMHMQEEILFHDKKTKTSQL